MKKKIALLVMVALGSHLFFNAQQASAQQASPQQAPASQAGAAPGSHRELPDISPLAINDSSPTRHGPENGSLIIIGGGRVTPDIWKKFTELAGGVDKANIVVITTAIGDSAAFATRSVEEVRKGTGVQRVTLLHTADIHEANSDKFVEPIEHATAVFFEGGRQWRPADSYLNTRTHKALLDLLKRGGVIAGSSAGASIQGSFLWRGDTRGPHIMIGDHTQGLGFLKNSVIDQHLLARNREFDLVNFIRQAPELIGIGLDQSTAIVVQKDTLQVIGQSYVAIYDYNTIIGKGAAHVIKNERGQDDEDFTASSGPFFFLSAGQRYDLKNRKVIPPPARKRERPAAPGAAAAPVAKTLTELQPIATASLK